MSLRSARSNGTVLGRWTTLIRLSVYFPASRYQASISFRRFSFNVSPLPVSAPSETFAADTFSVLAPSVVDVAAVVARWLDGCTITMQARKPISTRLGAGSDWWARGLPCKRSYREARHGIGDLIDPGLYRAGESIVLLVLIPISGYPWCAVCTAFHRHLCL